MDNGQEKKQDTAGKPEKKLSRTTLTFYIIGLFLFAIALILISYVSQVQSDKELENLSSQLNEQQTVSQGFSQKVEELQRQLDEQSRLIEAAKSAYDVKTNDELLEAIERIKRQDALQSKIIQAQNAAMQQNMEEAVRILEEVSQTFSEEELSVEGGILNAEDAQALQTLQKMMYSASTDETE